MIRPYLSYAALACLALSLSGCGAVAPKPDVVTVWNRLGIPQAFDAMNANRVNRRGNNPQRERTPPLKRIADPANLESPNDAIKAAAEIKIEEDLAPQKIKALKYLGTLGCGCYDKEGKVEAALLAGLNDCTEEVRKVAAETVLELVGDCCCNDGCNNNCCTEKIQEKLQDMAYGETDGCWHEPSAEVRQIAMSALSACPPVDVLPEDVDTKKDDKREGPSAGEVVPPGEPQPPVPPPAPLETSAPSAMIHGEMLIIEDVDTQEASEPAEFTATEQEQPSTDFYAPINVGFVEEVPAELAAPSVKVAPVSAELTLKANLSSSAMTTT